MTTEQLSAEISVEDRASRELERITRSVTRQNNEIMRLRANMERLRTQSSRRTNVNVNTSSAVRDLSRLERAYDSVGRAASRAHKTFDGIRSLVSKLGPAGLIGGAVGAIGGGYAAKQIFDSTFVNAANYEQSEKMIEAMFNNKKKTDQYMNTMQNQAINSPLLNSQDIFSNSKSFISITKNMDQLKQMWSLVEKLDAVDPVQGVEGGVLALRELFSGSTTSLVQRFEMPRKALNDIKKLPLDKQLTALTKLFNKMGMTDKLVKSMGDSTLGVWNQIKEVSDVALRKLGQPALDVIRPFLKEINTILQNGKLNKFVKVGQDMSKNIAKGFVGGLKGLGGWVERIYNNPEFKKSKTFTAKVIFVLEDINKTYNAWLKNGGKEQMADITKNVIRILAVGLVAAQDPLIKSATAIGEAVGKALISSADKAYVDYVENKLDTNKLYNSPMGIPFKYAAKAGIWLGDKMFGSSKKGNSKGSTTPHKAYTSTAVPSYAFGVKRIPHNNFPALLHEGEEVLTKQKANQQNNSRSISIAKLADQVVFREEADMDKFLNKLVERLDQDRINFGGVM